MRGGLGRRMVIWVPDDEYAPLPPVTIAVQAGRYHYPPLGIFGGLPSAKAQFLKNDQPADPSGLTFCQPGDCVAFYSAGGGGYGDPVERDPVAVERDVLHGYVGIESARVDYGVVIDTDGLKLDLVETKKLRALRSSKTSAE